MLITNARTHAAFHKDTVNICFKKYGWFDAILLQIYCSI